MPIRVPRHIARFLAERIKARRKLLESALLELHDIDNRLKMEFLSLTSLVDADIDGLDVDENESDLFAPLMPPDDALQSTFGKTTADFGPYELIDLDQELGFDQSASDIDSDLFIERIEEPPDLNFSAAEACSTNLSSPPSDTTAYFGRIFQENSPIGISSETDLPVPDTKRRTSRKRPQAANSEGTVHEAEAVSHVILSCYFAMPKLKTASTSVNQNTEPILSPPAFSSTPQNSQSAQLFTPDDLRRRRALNTTPDSSLSSVPSGRTRTKSATYGSGDQSSHVSPPWTRRQWNHVYTRLESNRSDNSDTDFPTDDDLPFNKLGSSLTPQTQWSRVFHFVLIILLPLICSIPFLGLYRTAPELSSTVIPLHSLTDQLSLEFPNQTKRFWAQLRAALEQQHRFSWSSVISDANALMMPAIILFVNRAAASSLDTNPEANDLFHRFITRFGIGASSIALRQKHPSCPRVDPMETEDDSPFASAKVKSSDALLKLHFDAKLRRLYDQGIRCFHFPSVDQLPPEVVILFHGVADSQNTVYKDALLLFSLQTTFDFDTSSDYTEQDVSSHRKFERQVQRHLRELWKPSLGLEETDALLSRLTPNVAVFHTTP
ncbi:hypothetical protein X801_08779 [Opisthorchis viverrini]|uniref:Uncharacterized protein n=2 Tax=Opisthorchis viverrini TaxID=6198 RepID=A0A074ZQE0_OPIVI|nr:hypothetical protein T265_05022 [Opisthorchis viverrini]KER28037.1 hypothetical protein T265_05022 [Opisthorchis viverrini]OON15418.1 hypothetical protein X801_08779 [Opisthorchis viverrini]